MVILSTIDLDLDPLIFNDIYSCLMFRDYRRKYLINKKQIINNNYNYLKKNVIKK